MFLEQQRGGSDFLGTGASLMTFLGTVFNRPSRDREESDGAHGVVPMKDLRIEPSLMSLCGNILSCPL